MSRQYRSPGSFDIEGIPWGGDGLLGGDGEYDIGEERTGIGGDGYGGDPGGA